MFLLILPVDQDLGQWSLSSSEPC